MIEGLEDQSVILRVLGRFGQAHADGSCLIHVRLFLNVNERGD